MIYPIIIIILVLFYITYFQHIENYCDVSNEVFQHLNFISTVLTNNNIKHWLTYSTLLGAVREQDILPHDSIFNLGANVDDVDKILALNANLDYYGYVLEKPFIYDQVAKKKVWKVSLKIYFKRMLVGEIYLYKKINDLDVGKVKNAYFPIPSDSKTLFRKRLLN